MDLPGHRARPIGLGLLGCADIATRRVLPAVRATPGIRLAAVASRTAARAESVAAEFGGRPVRDYRAVLGSPDVDAVYVPLPNELHADWIERALAAGKHVLAEKPLTTSFERTSELVDVASAAGLVLRENFMFLQHVQHEHVRRLLAEGAVGELRVLSAAFTIPPRPPDDIRYQPSLGGGSLLDNGVYPIKAAQLFLGTGLDVLGANLRCAAEVDTAGSALLARSDGVTAHLSFGMEHFYTSRYELHGSAGRITVDRAFTPPATYAPVIKLEREDGTHEIPVEPDDQYAKSIAAFVRAVRGSGEPTGAEVVDHARLVRDVRKMAEKAPLATPAADGR
ncbi:Gfo/Idh/MocA family oxidoreductase [Saccharopolyspora taberi]|uniref:Gfo/Idh/MocA family oxidoreductase n=1 Tax=Saccharopolyspora taberi TaxID=60895 RepID=A0ABN3V966_9PSEU